MNFRYKLMQFMSGRYGADALGNFILIFAVVLAVANIALRSLILQIIVYTLMFYQIYRLFSRNVEKRRKENRWFLDKASYFKRKKEIKAQRRADKCHVYKKCPKCKATLRLPYRVGKHKTVCPRCQKEFSVKVKER